MKLNFFSVLTVVFILLLSSFIYLYEINKIPNGFYVDEAAVAYNAYSILKTGKDEYGKSFPLLFRLFGSYTPPLFIYLSVPFIFFFGMEPFTFRLISVLSALASIVVFFLFIKKLELFKYSSSYFLATLFYAITPWLVFNARLGYEVTLAYLIFNIGIYFLYSALDKPRNFLWGIPILSLSVYVAHTQKYLFPVFLLFYFLVFKKIVFQKKNLRILFYSFLITFIMQIPNLILLLTPAFWVKSSQLTDKTLSQVIANTVLQLMNYYSPKSLFYKLPDIDLQHTIPEISVMYNWMIIPFLIGVYSMFKNIKKINFKFLALIFFATVIPAALSGYFISIQRALPFLLPLSFVIGLGIDEIAKKISRALYFGVVILVFVYSLVILYGSYFVLFPKERALAWHYGYEELSTYIAKNEDKNFMIDDSRNPRSYIELLYFLRYSPEAYQKEVDSYYREHYYQAPPQKDEFYFSNIELRKIDWGREICVDEIIVGDILSVSEEQVKEHNLTHIGEIKDPLGSTVFKLYKTNPSKNCLQGK